MTPIREGGHSNSGQVSTMEHFDNDELRQEVQTLSHWKRVTFMAACCERMLPNYRSFTMETGHGDPTRLSEALAAVWNSLETGQLPNSTISLVEVCERQAPDTAEFSSIYTSAALDTANSIATTLEALANAAEDQVLEVASLARDTVDLFVQQQCDLGPNDQGFEEQIAQHPLMQAELLAQRQSIEYLKSHADEHRLITIEVRGIFSGRSLPDSSEA